MVGKTATEFVEGVTQGVDESLRCDVSLSNQLSSNEISLGRNYVEDSSKGGKNNSLAVYFIFNEAVSDTLLAKAFDKNGEEVGRSKVVVNGQKDDAIQNS